MFAGAIFFVCALNMVDIIPCRSLNPVIVTFECMNDLFLFVNITSIEEGVSPRKHVGDFIKFPKSKVSQNINSFFDLGHNHFFISMLISPIIITFS